ncbi:hypothetical protein BH10BAC5_BH10BAC5_13170 [soil metagenome]
MKKVYTVIPVILLVAVISFIGFSQKTENRITFNKEAVDANRDIMKVSNVIEQKKLTYRFDKLPLFNTISNYTGKTYAEYVNDASFLTLNKNTQAEILSGSKENITLQIPYINNTFIEVELTKAKVTEDDMKVYGLSGSGKTQVTYIPGVHYRGIIKNKKNSIATLSVFNENVMGIFSDETGNYVLGSIKNDKNQFTNDYILYNDVNLKIKNTFKCGLDDNEDRFSKAMGEVKEQINDYHSKNLTANVPIRVYFEGDHDMYVRAGNNLTTLSNFISAFFNSVATIYQNEGIPTTISNIAGWTSTDPYANLTDSYEILISFGARNRDSFTGNLGHLLSTGHGGQLGGIAWIRTLCTQYNASDSSGRYAFSNIDPDYNNFPTYSWTVNVVTHEMGHNVGSYHTHACHWPINGQIRGIDTCVITEENSICASTSRARNGTIMSYCHLNGSINLAAGFGPLPGDTILAAYNTAGCFTQLVNSSERPAVFDLVQNFPNPYNPATTIKFNLPASARVNLKVYDMSGKEVANLISGDNLTFGSYNYFFDSQAYNLTSGVYFYKIVAEGANSIFTDVKKMVLVK